MGLLVKTAEWWAMSVFTNGGKIRQGEERRGPDPRDPGSPLLCCWFCSWDSVHHVRPVRKAGWEGVGWSSPSSENMWMEAWSSEPWERLRNGVHPVGLPQQKPWSCFVRHSFVCTCRGIRQHFETVYGDDSVNGLGHLSLLPEPASL